MYTLASDYYKHILPIDNKNNKIMPFGYNERINCTIEMFQFSVEHKFFN